ncbi:MAG: RnfABCDGE type electron transport complex subunit D [Deltaproteobacteria bacterium]|nr:RnfABCDGE type electron transport complex subunit D [Deltaproteobacteria bacterium]MBW2070402.1 RnfABCDGE type electron transport complex subunit D [Deltaproteobacteria bacterium]
MDKPMLRVSVAPHIQHPRTTASIMYHTLLALIPVALAGVFYFGFAAVKLIVICVATAVVCEAGAERIMGRKITLTNGSSVLLGLLFALLCSPELPWWTAVVGTAVAVLLGRQIFGGLGNNPFNAVLVGWAIVRISWAAQMTTWAMPEPRFWLEAGGYIEYPPLEVMRIDGVDALLDLPWRDLFLGNVPGTIGTVCIVAALIGGVYLLWRGIITWHIPVSFLASAWIFGLIFWLIDPEQYANPTIHLLSGWLVFGAFFLATDKGTIPVTAPGMIVFGIGCGLVTMIIRFWGGYVDGVAFAILFMNAAVPLLDRLRPRVYGRVREVA